MRATLAFLALIVAGPVAAQEQVIEENIIEEEAIIDPFLQENSINTLTLEQLADPDFVLDDVPFDELPPEQQDLLLGNQPPPGGYPEGTIETQPLDDAALQDAPPPDAEAAGTEMAEGSSAILRGLDTLNGTVRDFTIRVGETLEFERLHVSLYACRYPPDDIEGEALAFLNIRDKRESEDRFKGWMLASSPALSALDHPRYDIWVLSCKTD